MKKEKEKSKKPSHPKRMGSAFDKKKTYKKRRLSKIVVEFLEKAGIDLSPKEFNKKLLQVDLVILVVLSIAVIIASIILSSRLQAVITLLVGIWTIVAIGLYLVSILAVFAYLDIRIYQRTKQIEEVLPDYLQLTSANISAGMTIDRALWFAVRPRFGVLAKEIEEVAKANIAGEDLPESLQRFSKKYNSKILRESINLIVEGLHSGGELAPLLSKISENILDIKLMKKEISASVTTYVIFIGAASVVAAPLLFALSGQLLIIIQNIAGSVASSSSSGPASLVLSFSTDSIDIKDFETFSLVLLTITSYFASAIIATIQKGTSKEGLKTFPLFVVISIIIYYVVGSALGGLFSGLF